MTERVLRIYLDDHHQRRLALGRHNFLVQVVEAFKDYGYRVAVRPDSDQEMLKAGKRNGFSLFHMISPIGERGLTFRLAYVFPFWKIEATGTRWNFGCAKARFDPGSVSADEAAGFVDRVRNREMPWAKVRTERNTIYVPLQGQLQICRAHQVMSPMDMVRKTIDHFPDHPIKVTLHPRESYSEEDLKALHGIVELHPQAEVSRAEAKRILPESKLVVTQNSSTAFQALFLKIPSVLFAQSDFHHATFNAEAEDPDKAFESAMSEVPDYDRYLYWFLQIQSINAGREDVQDRIIDRVRELGWDI